MTAAGRPGARPRRRPPIASAPTARVDPRTLDVVTLTNPRKQGDNLVTGTPGRRRPAGAVRAGALEGSGADAARSMVDMIASMRAFEAGQKVIQTIDETLGKAVDAGRQS